MTKTVRQTVLFNATPHEVYEALLDSRTHSAFTGGKARIVRRVGGSFSAFGGWATGKIRELEKDRKIVQTWRTDDFRARDPDSTLTFTLRARGPRTALTMVHTGLPDGQAADVRKGWTDYYWKPLKAFLRS